MKVIKDSSQVRMEREILAQEKSDLMNMSHLPSNANGMKNINAFLKERTNEF